MRVVIIDGQGGGCGKALTEALRAQSFSGEIIAVGTNAAATNAMLKSGADKGATGENAVIYNCAHADVVAGPIGIVLANALLGEISPNMALAAGGSSAHKVLIPASKCNTSIIGLKSSTLAQLIADAANKIIEICNSDK